MHTQVKWMSRIFLPDVITNIAHFPLKIEMKVDKWHLKKDIAIYLAHRGIPSALRSNPNRLASTCDWTQAILTSNSWGCIKAPVSTVHRTLWSAGLVQVRKILYCWNSCVLWKPSPFQTHSPTLGLCLFGFSHTVSSSSAPTVDLIITHHSPLVDRENGLGIETWLDGTFLSLNVFHLCII